MESGAAEVVERDGERAGHLLCGECVCELFADSAEGGPVFGGDHFVAYDSDDVEEPAFFLVFFFDCEYPAALSRDDPVFLGVFCAHGCVWVVLCWLWAFLIDFGCFFYFL